MRKKSFIKIMLSLCMIIMLVVPFKTSAKSNRSGFGDDSISLIGMCPYCPVSSFTVLVNITGTFTPPVRNEETIVPD